MTVHELFAHRSSLEEAFMEMTRDSVEYHATGRAVRGDHAGTDHSGRPELDDRRPGTALGHVLRSEWTKVWSVRSTFWTLLTLVVVTIGLVHAGSPGARPTRLKPHEPGRSAARTRPTSRWPA